MRTFSPPYGKRATSPDGVDAVVRRAEAFVDDDAAVDLEPGGFGEIGARLHADAHHDEVGRELFAVVEHDACSP